MSDQFLQRLARRCSGRAVLALAGVLLVATPAAAQSIPDVAPHLKPGDVVRIEVWRQPEFSGEFEITGDGTLAHPLLRELRVADREVTEVEAGLRRFLERFVDDPAFVVEGFFRVPVGGEVREPDMYTLRPATSIPRAIALAGGVNRQGDLEKVTLRRGGEEYTIDLTDPSERFRELEVRSGDEIVVERRRDIFREYIAPYASVVAAFATILRLVL